MSASNRPGGCGVHARLLLLCDAELVRRVVEVSNLTSVHQRLQPV